MGDVSAGAPAAALGWRWDGWGFPLTSQTRSNQYIAVRVEAFATYTTAGLHHIKLETSISGSIWGSGHAAGLWNLNMAKHTGPFTMREDLATAHALANELMVRHGYIV
jgi:hypothetical protein